MMHRVTTTWTAIVAAALLALPTAGQAQPPQPSSAQAPPGPAQAAGSREAAADGHHLAYEHLYKADAALSGIAAESIPAGAQARVADVKRHISILRQAGTEANAARETAAPLGSGREEHLAAIERLITELLGPASASGTPAAPSRPIGTTGIAGDTATLGESARSSLQQVRAHITAYAAAIGSLKTPAPGRPGEAARDPANSGLPPSSATSQPRADSASPMTSLTDPTPSPTGTSPASMPQTPEPESGRGGSQAPGGSQTAPGSAGSPQQENGLSRQHLIAARDALTEFTQMSGASEISGDTRTQVTQLISNFNQMIVTDTAWRSSLGKVKANLRALLSDGATAGTAPPAEASAPSDGVVVGTAGQSQLEPQYRAKLVEFQSHLQAFEHAVTGGSPAMTPVPSGDAEPLDPPSDLRGEGTEHAARPRPDGTTGDRTTSTATSNVTATSQATDRLDPDPASEPPLPGGAGGTTYTGSQDPRRTAGPAPRPDSAPAVTTGQAAAPGRAEALKHIAAMEAILLGQSAPRGTSAGNRPAPSAGPASAGATSGTSGTQPQSVPTEKGATLGEAQIDEIRVHLRELRRLLAETRGQ